MSLAGQAASLPFVATSKMYGAVHDYTGANEATLSGAIDIVVSRCKDGTLKSTPFHVRFGKFTVAFPSDKVVDIKVNDKDVPLKMKLGKGGEAFFVTETVGDDWSSSMEVSPIMSPRRLAQADRRSTSPENLHQGQQELNRLQDQMANITIPTDEHGRARSLSQRFDPQTGANGPTTGTGAFPYNP